MSEGMEFQPGSFNWIDLATTDPDGAKAFYGSMFGWTSEDRPMGEGNFYTMFLRDGKFVGGMYRMMEDQLAQGIPPHWNAYVAVESAEAAVAKAKSLGGNVLMEPFDVYDAGRMAVLQDPTGAIFEVWEKREHPGAGVIYQPGSLGWTELLTNDTAKAETFYTALFGWKPEANAMGVSGYTVFMNGEQYACGMMAIQAEWGPMPPNWMVYIVTANCDASANQAEELGGKICMPPMDIPEVGRFAVITDPQGATFGVFQMKEQPK